jgi:plasmid maintenance system antidote protein VapI
MMKQPPMKLSDQVRQAVADSGSTRYRIAQDTGIDESALAKFYNGHRGLSMDSLDRLGTYLGLRIVTEHTQKESR